MMICGGRCVSGTDVEVFGMWSMTSMTPCAISGAKTCGGHGELLSCPAGEMRSSLTFAIASARR